MNRDQLHYFRLVYESGSFALAGKAIPLSTQGVSRSIRSLEHELKRPLFADTTLKPSRYADALYDFVKASEANYIDLMHTFEVIAAEETSVIRVGFSFGLLDVIGSRVFDDFTAQHADTKFVFEEVSDTQCDEGVVDRIYDLGFTVHPIPDQLDCAILVVAPMSLWVNIKNPLSTKNIIRVADLENCRIATPMPGAKNVDRLLERCEEEGVSPKEIFHFQQMFHIYDFVRENRGVGTYIEKIIVSSLFHDDSVKVIPFDDFCYTFSISWAKNHPLTQLEEAFVAFICGRFGVSCKKGVAPVD